MRAVVQRVLSASVKVRGEVTGRIEEGLMVLAAVQENDTDTDVAYIANKLLKLRIFSDSAGRMNLSVIEAKGKVLMVSQFTLMGDARKGLRPSFDSAEAPEKAKEILEELVEKLREGNVDVETGRFGEDMEVALVNNGPVTIMLDSRKIF